MKKCQVILKFISYSLYMLGIFMLIFFNIFNCFFLLGFIQILKSYVKLKHLVFNNSHIPYCGSILEEGKGKGVCGRPSRNPLPSVNRRRRIQGPFRMSQ